MCISPQCQMGSPAAKAGEVGLVRIGHGCQKVVASDSLAIVSLEVKVHALPASSIWLVDKYDSNIRAAVDRPLLPKEMLPDLKPSTPRTV